MPPRDNQFTPAEKLIESQSCSGRGACGFVLTVLHVLNRPVKEGSATILSESDSGCFSAIHLFCKFKLCSASLQANVDTGHPKSRNEAVEQYRHIKFIAQNATL
jgi:hypothetical protein